MIYYFICTGQEHIPVSMPYKTLEDAEFQLRRLSPHLTATHYVRPLDVTEVLL